MSEYIDYQTEDGSYWRAELWSYLSAKFSLEDEDLVLWHKVMCQQNGWMSLQRIYRVWPVIEANADSMRQWSLDDVAKDTGQSVAFIEEMLVKMVDFWGKQKSALKVNVEFGGQEVDEDAFKLFEIMEPDEVDNYLKMGGFGHLTDPDLRAVIADRVRTLLPEMRQKNLRPQVVALIQHEINMLTTQRNRNHCDSQMQELQKRSPLDEKEKEELFQLEKRITALDKQYANQAATHPDLLENLGVKDADMNQRKRTFIETVSYLFERVRQYHADPEHKLLDGVFTAEEIDWQLTPTKLRSAQYRPDVVVMVQEALKPENFFDESYTPTKVQRQVARDLSRIVTHLRSEDDIVEIQGIDDVEPEGGEDGVELGGHVEVKHAGGEEFAGVALGETPVYMGENQVEEDGVIG